MRSANPKILLKGNAILKVIHINGLESPLIVDNGKYIRGWANVERLRLMMAATQLQAYAQLLSQHRTDDATASPSSSSSREPTTEISTQMELCSRDEPLKCTQLLDAIFPDPYIPFGCDDADADAFDDSFGFH
jgi:hypothetical protein